MAPETRTEVRAIMIDPRQGEMISELMDYQRSADPAGCSELDLSTSELSLLMATPN